MTSVENLNLYYHKFKGKTAVAGLYHFLSPVLLPIEPEPVKNILTRDFESFHSRGFFYNKEDGPVGVNILTLDGQEWRDRRLKFSPIFTSGKIKKMFEVIDGISDKMINIMDSQLSETNDFNMRNWSHRFTSENIGNVAFGIESNPLEDKNSEFTYYGKRLVELSPLEGAKFIFSAEFPKVARNLHFGFAAKDASDFFLKTFIRTLEYREKNHIDKNDFVSLLLGLKDLYTIQELAAEAFLIYSSTLMTYVLYELALNQDIQDRVRKEITTEIEEKDGKLTYEMLFGFKYLDMVINETLRKHPPIPTYFRKCTKEYKIPDTNLVVPAGVLILINSFSFQRDPEYFPEPEKFDPDRFNMKNIKNISPLINLPFEKFLLMPRRILIKMQFFTVNGPRKCLGRRFGLMQSKIGVVKLIKNFIITPSAKTPIPLKYVLMSSFLAPEGGMWLKLKKIKM